MAPADGAFLDTLYSGSAMEKLAALAEEAGSAGIVGEEAAVRLGSIAESITEAASAAVAAGRLVRLKDRRLLTPASWTRAVEDVAKAVKRHAEANLLRDGMPKGDLKSALARELPGPVFDEALEILLAGGRLALRGDRVTLPEPGPALSPKQEQAIGEMERRLTGKGYQVPDVSELTRGIPPTERPGELVRYLVDSGRAVKVTSELLYPRSLWDELEGRLRAHFRSNETLTMGAFKDLAQRKDGPVPVDGVLIRLGRTYLDAGKSKEAEQTFNRLVDEFPNSPFSGDARRELDQLKKT